MTGSEAIRLRLLGEPAVEGPGEDAAGIQSQPKRLALLAYLAVQGGFVRRDVLAEMFWPDSDADKARRALSQATHILRRSLGRSAIRNRGVEELGICPDHVWIDVRAFEAAVAGERWAEAVELHRDELLHGLNPDQVSPSFSRWLDGERLRLQRSAAVSAKKLADAAFRDGDVAGAIAWARRAVAVRPLDESMFREYIALLDEAGDAAQALSEYESFRSRLSTEYDLEPARETVRLIEMIRIRRPEAVPAVRTPESDVDTVPDYPAVSAIRAAPDRVPAVSSGRGVSRSHMVLRLAALPIILLGFLGWYLASALPDSEARPLVIPDRIAVLPFENVGAQSERVDLVARLLTQALIDHAGSYPSLRVVPIHVVSDYSATELTFDSVTVRLQAAMYVLGRIDHGSGDSIWITLDLLDARGELQGTRRLRFESIDQSPIISEVVAAVTELSPLIQREMERVELLRGTNSQEAYEQIIHALTYADEFNEHLRSNRVELAGLALARSEAHLDSAEMLDRRWLRPRIERARLQAFRTDYCYISQSCVAVDVLREGIEAVTEVLLIEPNNADALETRASLRWDLWVHGAADTTLLELAKADADAAIINRPRSPRAYSTLSNIYSERGEYEAALQSAREALELDEFLTKQSLILHHSFEAAFNLMQDSVARDACARLIAVSPTSLRTVGCLLQLMAWSDDVSADIDDAWQVVDELKATQYWSYNKAAAELLVATVIAAASDVEPSLADSARAVIERALAERLPADDEPLLYAAAAHARLGDSLRAIRLLEEYQRTGVSARWHVLNRRWFRDMKLSDSVKLYPGESGR